MKYDYIPEVTGNLRKSHVQVPKIIQKCSGIRILGKHIKSLIFTTDVAIIKNTDADAVMAVYPFTPQPTITQAILSVSDIPVICGVGGGLTHGIRSANIALHAEFQGAIGVILNSPAPHETIRYVKEHIDIPVITSVATMRTDIKGKIEAGADIINVSGGKETISIIREIRKEYPHIPIIATGGSSDETIEETIRAGANCIIYTPPSITSLFREKMSSYREGELGE